MTKSQMSSTSDSNPFDRIINDQEAALRERLLDGSALVALELDAALTDYRKLATALRLVVERHPPADDISADFIEAHFAYQLSKDADLVAANAEARALQALRVMQGVWKGILDGERQRQRWAKIHEMQARGTR